MSSSPLYLAIVVVWLIVLVPMLLRKDPDTFHEDPREDEEPAGTEALSYGDWSFRPDGGVSRGGQRVTVSRLARAG